LTNSGGTESRELRVISHVELSKPEVEEEENDRVRQVPMESVSVEQAQISESNDACVVLAPSNAT
jgi:hypothetical protein